jgi:hypothetical protein
MTRSFAISMDEEASPGEVEAVAAAFGEAGFDGPVSADIGRRSFGDLPFVVYVGAVPTAFLTAFAAEGGRDAYASLKRFVRDVSEARRGREGTVVVQDREDRDDSTVLVLSADLPDRAFAALEDLDLEALKGAYLVWDRDGDKGWHDPMAP